MTPSVMLPFASAAFTILGFLFAKNVRTGLLTGKIYVQRIQYDRVEEPFFFWFGAAFYAVLTAGAITAACLGIWATFALT